MAFADKRHPLGPGAKSLARGSTFAAPRKGLKRKSRVSVRADLKPAAWSLAAKGETQCRACGRTAHDPHHAAPRSIAPAGRSDLRNCLPLCRGCHDRWHNGTPLPRSVFRPDELSFVSSLVTASWLDARYPEVVEVDDSTAPEVVWPE